MSAYHSLGMLSLYHSTQNNDNTTFPQNASSKSEVFEKCLYEYYNVLICSVFRCHAVIHLLVSSAQNSSFLFRKISLEVLLLYFETKQKQTRKKTTTKPSSQKHVERSSFPVSSRFLYWLQYDPLSDIMVFIFWHCILALCCFIPSPVPDMIGHCLGKWY